MSKGGGVGGIMDIALIVFVILAIGAFAVVIFSHASAGVNQSAPQEFLNLSNSTTTITSSGANVIFGAGLILVVLLALLYVISQAGRF